MDRVKYLKERTKALLATAGGLALVLGSLVAASAPASSTELVAVPPECQNTGENNGTWIRTAFPHDATTGPEVGGYDEDNLTSSGRTGRWLIRQDGTVIDGVFHNGFIDVRADNVTIRNSVICGQAFHLIRNTGQNLTIENSIIRGERGGEGQPCLSAVSWGNYTLTKSEVTYCTDLIKVSGFTEVTDSWFHDAFTHRLPNGQGTHNDTAQKNVNRDLIKLKFEGNAAYGDPCTSNRHFQITNASNDEIEIEENFFYGLHGIVNIGGTVNGHISKNTLAGSATEGPFSDFDTGHMAPGLWTGNHQSLSKPGNVFETGQPVPADGKADPYVCVP